MSILTATGAGVRHRRRWLFQDLDVSVQPGEIVAIVGPPGSGRTTVLLALARRFKLSAGSVQGSAALGYVPQVTQPEPVLTVLEHVRERLLLMGRSGRDAGQVRLHGLDPGLKGFELSPYQRQVIGVVLAQLEDPQVIALDGVDDGLDLREQGELWGLLTGLAEAGLGVLVTAREVDPARVSTVVRLGGARSVGAMPPAAAANQMLPETLALPALPAGSLRGSSPGPASVLSPDDDGLPGDHGLTAGVSADGNSSSAAKPAIESPTSGGEGSAVGHQRPTESDHPEVAATSAGGDGRGGGVRGVSVRQGPGVAAPQADGDVRGGGVRGAGAMSADGDGSENQDDDGRGGETS